MYRFPGFVVSSISHPSQPGLEGDCSAGDIGGGDNSDSRAAIGELGGGDSRAAIGEPEVLANAGRAARSDTAMKHASTTSIAGERKG